MSNKPRFFDALTFVAALEMLGAQHAGKAWTAVCVWCLATADPQETCLARRAGGDCLRCAYSGRDTFVALLPVRS